MGLYNRGKQGNVTWCNLHVGTVAREVQHAQNAAESKDGPNAVEELYFPEEDLAHEAHEQQRVVGEYREAVDHVEHADHEVQTARCAP